MAMPVLFALTFEILMTKYLVYFKNHFRISNPQTALNHKPY